LKISHYAITKKLQKFGRANDATPAAWNEKYTDFNAPLGEDGVIPKPTPAATKEVEMTDAADVADAASEAASDSEKKKRKRTDEEKAERKAKKEAKKEKKAKKAKKEDSDSE
jgi:H/ACA ribonucleoprotein complex subunit 4